MNIKNTFRNIFIIVIILCCSACSIHFDFPYYYEYDNSFESLEEENKRIEEERLKKEEERKRKIASRTYIDDRLNGYYAMLNDEEKQVYYDIVENANSFYNDFFDLTYRVSIERLRDIFMSVVYDNPDLFWLNTYWYYKDSDTNEVYSVMLIYYYRNSEDEQGIENIVDYVKEKNKEVILENRLKKEQLDNIVNNIVNDANKYSSVLEKEKYVHDLLVNKITYDENTRNDQTPYSALIYNKAVCAGYAKSFQLIMKKLNIPTFYVNGEAWDSEGRGNHAWNLILIDNEYYNVDVTWDDLIDYYGRNIIRYDYFNINDEKISKDHIRSERSVNLPSAMGTTYSNLYR